MIINNISPVVYQIHKKLSQENLSVPRSHLFELIAALLGYNTYAALLQEEENPDLEYHLDDAELLILNSPKAIKRTHELEINLTALELCIKELKENMGPIVFESVEDFYDEHAREQLEEIIYNSEESASVMAESNADFPEYPELDEKFTISADLWGSPIGWSIESSGTLVGQYYENSDRMYNGDTLNVWGKIIYCKAGRSGLIFLDSEAGASLDDSWHDD